MKLRMLLDDPVAAKMWPSTADKNSNLFLSNARNSLAGVCSGNLQGKKVDMKAQKNNQGFQRRDGFTGSEPPNPLIQSGVAIARKRRIHAQV